MSVLPGKHRPYQDQLRYKHMVARLQGLSAHKLETEILRELAKGTRWRIDAALEALAGHDERYNRINGAELFEAAGRYGRLTAMHRLTEVYQSEKIDRSKNKWAACSHGILAAFDLAVINDHYRVAAFLRQFGAQHGYSLGKDGHPRAMFVAIDRADEKKIAFLLQGTDPQLAAYYLTPAVYSKNPRMVEVFLDAGADVDSKADRHWTPLHTAARANDHATVDLLIARGARVEACAADFLHDLIGHDSFAMFSRMIDLGAKPQQHDLAKAASEGRIEFIVRILQTGLSATPETLVHAVASDKADKAAIGLLLADGVSVNDAMHWLSNNLSAYRHSGSGKRTEIMACLLDLAVSASAPPALSQRPPAP